MPEERTTKALFMRKASDLKELKETTEYALLSGKKGEPFIVTREIALSAKEFREFANDLLADQSWILEREGGYKEGKARCIRVINAETEERVLINPEGYSYPRYTAIEL